MSNYNYGYSCNKYEYEKDISNKINSSGKSQLTLEKHKRDKYSNEKEYRDDFSKDNYRKKIKKDNNNSSDKSSYQD